MKPIALGLILATCLAFPAVAAEPGGPAALITRTEAVRIAIQGQIADKTGSGAAQQVALAEYYSVPDRRLLWVDESGLTPRGKAIVAEIAKADDYGLRASDYSLPDNSLFNPSDADAVDWLAGAELKISTAVLEYAKDARGGRLEPQRLSKNLDPTLFLPNPAEVIAFIALRSDPAAYLRSFQPSQPQFEALRQKLLQLRNGGEPAEPADPPVVVIPDGPVLKLGVDHEHVALLRKRLTMPVSTSGNETLFDNDVFEAVRQFQREHGLGADGMVGAGTRARLNNKQAPQQPGGDATIQALVINMERWRWLPQDLGPFYVTVNIPEFMLRIVDDGTPIHETRVVVGKTDKQTPVFSDFMEEIVFRPYWNVPNSIKTEEIAPYLYQGGGFFGGGWDTSVLRRHNLRIRGYNGRDIDPDSVDWGSTDIRRYELYQPPGPGNVLGMMKFVFPNTHDVYMHDTTQKHLFAKAVRTESHGCMRVQNPDQVATILLKQDQDWTAGHVASAVQGHDDNHIALKQHIPVYITYLTLRVNDDGSMARFRDIYGHDARMAAALSGEPLLYDTPTVPQEVVASDTTRRVNRRVRQRATFENDFTRALFGF
ncbi:MAG: L,D-transpeptidase family protein [Methyloceanibacter sp.]|uniref:L,D-transpeptidase family protein n=1 Tax=Methyloceanibacter sp. TaxID=1965321 RepID=UPI003D6C7139